MTTTTAQAARTLSLREAQVTDVEDSDEGVLIRTTDGVVYIVVDPDRPDGAGRSGVMLLAKPKESGDYAIPVFTPHPAPAEVEADDIETALTELEAASESAQAVPAVEAPPRSGKGSGEKAWREFATSLEVDLEGCTSRDDVIAACEEAGVIDPEESDGE